MTGIRNTLTRSAVLGRILGLCLGIVALLAGLNSCDRTFFEYEGDCSVNYFVKFRYDYNMKWADAFAHEVKSVTLYLADADGNIVWQKTEEGDALAAEDYAMSVDVDPGQYDLLVWAGTKDNGSFTVPQASKTTQLTCTLGTVAGEDGAYVDGEVDQLYYGWLGDQTFSSTEGTYYYTVPLVKDTNHVMLALQHTSGDVVDKDKFTFLITSDNALMDWDNSLLPGGDLTYYAWNVEQGEADFDTRATYSAAIAEYTIGRLVDGHETRVTVLNNETGETTFSYPLVDIAKLFRGYYNKDMEDQEFLDRQDEFDIVVFLDEGDRWVSASINILSWKVVIQRTVLQ